MVDEQLVVALRDTHRRQDRARRVRADDEIDLVDGDELLVERARELGLRLVVADDPFDRPPEQTVLRVQLVDVDLADDLVDLPGRGQRSGERERAADADRLARRRGERGAGRSREREARHESTDPARHVFIANPPCLLSDAVAATGAPAAEGVTPPAPPTRGSR